MSSSVSKIKVIGIGPGHKRYILPAVYDALEMSDVVIGAKRNLKSFDFKGVLAGKECIEISSNLEDIIQFIKNNYHQKRISVIASGDPGFYGILRYLKRHFNSEELHVIPGISSIQYMFSAIGIMWDDAYLGSLHARDDDIIDRVKQYKKLAYLTDADHSFPYIAGVLCNHGFGDRMMYVGTNLSYEDETILKNSAKFFVDNTDDYSLSVVVITDE